MTLTGADPTIENAMGHIPSAYIKSQAVKNILKQTEDKVLL